jgi:hypothetical protein
MGKTHLESALSSTSLIRVPNRGSYTIFRLWHYLIIGPSGKAVCQRPKIVAAHPGAADLTIDRIGDLLDYKLSDLLGTTLKGKRT